MLIVGIEGIVAGIDRTTGEWVWRHELPGGGLGEVALAIDEELIVASAGGNGVFCLAYPSGEQRWSAKTTSGGRATILLDGDAIYVCKAGYVDCFSRSGEPRWSQHLKGLGVGRAAVGVPNNVVQADDPGAK